MNIDKLLHKYFIADEVTPNIEVFDTKNIYAVYSDIVNLLNGYPDIELSVLQGLSYCFYEVLDNVLTHSEKVCGTVMMRYVPKRALIQILVADDGIGIQKSLSSNPLYANLSEEEALKRCIEDKVTDGKGMGFGLYTTSRLINNVGIRLDIHSGNSVLKYDGMHTLIDKDDCWQGTIVYFELHSDKDFDPNEIVEYRTDCVSQFNEAFMNDAKLDELW